MALVSRSKSGEVWGVACMTRAVSASAAELLSSKSRNAGSSRSEAEGLEKREKRKGV